MSEEEKKEKCKVIKRGVVDCAKIRMKDRGDRQTQCREPPWSHKDIKDFITFCGEEGVDITEEGIKKITKAARACNDCGGDGTITKAARACNDCGGDGISPGAIAGIVIGGVVIIAIMGYVIMRRRGA